MCLERFYAIAQWHSNLFMSKTTKAIYCIFAMEPHATLVLLELFKIVCFWGDKCFLLLFSFDRTRTNTGIVNTRKTKKHEYTKAKKNSRTYRLHLHNINSTTPQARCSLHHCECRVRFPRLAHLFCYMSLPQTLSPVLLSACTYNNKINKGEKVLKKRI